MLHIGPMAKLWLCVVLSSAFCLATCPVSHGIPTPDLPVLSWTKNEIGAMFSFNMITMLSNVTNTQFFCIGAGGGGGWVPSVKHFNPEMLDIDNWLNAAVTFGAKYAVLTAQHCSGFSMWPTDIKSVTGFEYTYSTKYSTFRGGSYDVVLEFVSKCKKHGIKPGLYYSLNQNYYLNVGLGKILDTSLVPGQVNVSQELYADIVLAQLTELWSNYGDWAELWFDGGCTAIPSISDRIANLLEKLQPKAVYFQACGKENNIRWIGTESGSPNYPVWSASNRCKGGQGDPDGNVFCPAEADTTLQSFDRWFWRDGFQIRSLEELKDVYFSSVGRNTNLLLNVAPNSSGLISEESADRYREFGEWITECFSDPVHATSGTGSEFDIESSESFLYNVIAISEDQTNGQAIRGFTLYNKLGDVRYAFFSGSSIGNKFLYRLPNTMKADGVYLNITISTFTPYISNFSLYQCK